MAEANNLPETPAGEDSLPSGQPPENADGKSSAPSVDPAEQARREQQSKKDRANSEKDDLRETVEFLTSREAERERDNYIVEFLGSSSDYPDVKSDDPMFKYATSKDDVEEIAKTLQNKYKDMQQKALASVLVEGEQSLTDEQIAEKEAELEKQTQEHGKSTFGSWLDVRSRRKKA